MNNEFFRVIERAFLAPAATGVYDLMRELTDLLPNQAIRETADYDFDLVRYARDGHCMAVVSERPVATSELEWENYPGRVREVMKRGLVEVAWRGESLRVIMFPVPENCNSTSIVIGPTHAVVDEFFAAVCLHSTKNPESIEIMDGGFWQGEDGRLRQAIEDADIGNLVLADDMRKRIEDTVLGFFDHEARYKELELPWKRGVLLHGPPGNGKTAALRAMVKLSGRPALYLRKPDGYRVSEAEGLKRLFRRARQIAPCVVVMEDVDSLVPKEALSALLNELDGFQSNHGIMVLATTNYPERLDPALAHRPSRFDRKIEFVRPNTDVRRAYLAAKTLRWPEGRRLSEVALTELAEETHGFSFAYLQELIGAAVMAWLDADKSMEVVMREQLAVLRTEVGGKVKKKKKAK
jgi:AAA+ superfamily predicted ATPase